MDENVWVKLVFILRWNAFIHLAIPFSLSSRCPHHSNLWKHFFLSVFSLGPCVSTSTECPTHGIVITQSLNSRCHLFSSRQILSSARASRLFWTLRATTWPLVLPLVIPLNCIYCRGWPQVSICISLLQVKLSKQRSHYSHASKPVPLTGLGLVQTAFFFFLIFIRQGSLLSWYQPGEIISSTYFVSKQQNVVIQLALSLKFLSTSHQVFVGFLWKENNGGFLVV